VNEKSQTSTFYPSRLLILGMLLLVFWLTGCTVDFDNTPLPISGYVPSIDEESAIRFVVLGDYGSRDRHSAAVAKMVRSWQPDFIITTGDNNYKSGSANTLKTSEEAYYGEYLDNHRFYPALGNHDQSPANLQAYLAVFSIKDLAANTGSSNNERYYDYVQGPIHFFVLDSNDNEPDGATSDSKQAQWLKAELAASTTPWQVVYFHHPPFSSGFHGPTDRMQWPFDEWGVDVVFSGHDHDYERLSVNGLTSFVNGIGGARIRRFDPPVPGSQVRFNDDYGAMMVTADASHMIIEFYAITDGGTLIDRHVLSSADSAD
jgi:tartrate-resistant acid phosphatase type 5